MDASRDADFRNLHRIFSDSRLPKDTRKRAYLGYQRIQEQVKDRQLFDLRLRLIRATRANDTDTVSKLEQYIGAYSWRKGYVRQF